MATSQPLNTDDNMIVNDPSSSHTETSAHPDALTYFPYNRIVV